MSEPSEAVKQLAKLGGAHQREGNHLASTVALVGAAIVRVLEGMAHDVERIAHMAERD